MYFETLDQWPGGLTLGGLEADRLQMARFRSLRAEYYVPLETFTAMNQQEWQHHPQIHALYSQAAGWTHYLMHGAGPDGPVALTQLLDTIYRGRSGPQTLTQLLQAPATQLDTRYQDFLRIDDGALQHLDRTIRPRQLCLGRTAVTEAGLQSLESLQQCEWLDLFGLPITDRLADRFTQLTQVRQLSLERTEIGDATVRQLVGCQSLQQLDLSFTKVTDASLAIVAQLPQLRDLWLAGTAITDEGLQRLANCKTLQTIDLRQTQTTAAGFARLQQSLPQLQAAEVGESSPP